MFTLTQSNSFVVRTKKPGCCIRIEHKTKCGNLTMSQPSSYPPFLRGYQILCTHHLVERRPLPFMIWDPNWGRVYKEWLKSSFIGGKISLRRSPYQQSGVERTKQKFRIWLRKTGIWTNWTNITQKYQKHRAAPGDDSASNSLTRKLCRGKAKESCSRKSNWQFWIQCSKQQIDCHLMTWLSGLLTHLI